MSWMLYHCTNGVQSTCLNSEKLFELFMHCSIFLAFSLLVQVTEFEPLILQSGAECSTTVPSGTTNLMKFLEMVWTLLDCSKFLAVFSANVSGRIRTLDLTIMSWMLYHCTTKAQPTCLKSQKLFELFTDCSNFLAIFSPDASGRIQTLDLTIMLVHNQLDEILRNGLNFIRLLKIFSCFLCRCKWQDLNPWSYNHELSVLPLYNQGTTNLLKLLETIWTCLNSFKIFIHFLSRCKWQDSNPWSINHELSVLPLYYRGTTNLMKFLEMVWTLLDCSKFLAVFSADASGRIRTLDLIQSGAECSTTVLSGHNQLAKTVRNRLNLFELVQNGSNSILAKKLKIFSLQPEVQFRLALTSGKSFIFSWGRYYKTFLSLINDFCNNLERLSLASLSSLV